MEGDDEIAAEAVARELEKPNASENWLLESDEYFSPWVIFDVLYGVYDSRFDDLAIAVLRDINAGTHKREGLDAQIFREILCTKNLCDYGGSPRTCFPTPEFKALLPSLIERWEAYRKVQWEEADNG